MCLCFGLCSSEFSRRCSCREPRHAWDQTPEDVQLYIFHDGIGDAWREGDASCSLNIRNSSVEFYFLEGGGAKWSLNIALYCGIDPSASHYKVRKDRISIKLRKIFHGQVWPALHPVDILTMENIPALPESFKAPKDVSDAQAERAAAELAKMKDSDEEEEDAVSPAGASAAPWPPWKASGKDANEIKLPGAPMNVGRSGEGTKWDEMGESQKMNVMATERKILEQLLGAAKMGELATLQKAAENIAHSNALDVSQILDEYLDGNKRGVVHLAAATGHLLVLQWAMQCGADLALRDTHGQNAFFIAAANGHAKSVEMLAAETEVDVDAHDSSTGATALHHAAGNGDAPMVQLLLQLGANVNANSQLGPAIQWASMSEHHSMVNLLISNGASPEICALSTPGVARNLPPPLVMSAAMMQTDVCALYLAHGALVDATDEEVFV